MLGKMLGKGSGHMSGDASSTGSESVIAQAQRLVEAGHLEEALQACLQEITQDSSDLSLWNYVAEIHSKLGRKDAALAAQRRVAELLLGKGDSERAILTYRTILSTHPHDADAQLALAMVYRQQGQTSRAALSYEMAAQSLASQGKLVESLAVAQQIVEMSPENVARRLRLADQYAKANLLSESVREFAASAALLRSANRIDEYSRVLERLHLVESKLGKTSQPSLAEPDQGASSQHTVGVSRELAGANPPRAATAAETLIVSADHSSRPGPGHEDAAVLIAEADSYLRLGLVDKAVEHLTAALARNPFLRKLREPLVQLLVAQQKPKQAVAELWEMLKQSHSPQEKLRYLRYILRLDARDHAARLQLSVLQSALAEDSGSENEASLTPELAGAVASPQLSMAAMDSVLLHALDGRRPATDVAVTAVIQMDPLRNVAGAVEPIAKALTDPSSSSLSIGGETAADWSSDSAASPHETVLPPSATTRPGAEEIEAIAEEIALSSRSFREDLEEVDRCVQDGKFEDALRHLNILAACYPNSQSIQAQLREIECVLAGPSVIRVAPADVASGKEPSAQAEPTEDAADSSLPVSTEIAAAIRALRDPSEPSQVTPSLPVLISGAKTELVRTTMEVDPSDIEAELSLQSLRKQSSDRRPPPPRPPRKGQSEAADVRALAFRNGVVLLGRGRYAEALVEFEKAQVEPSLGARAALMMGRCLRELSRIPEAIEVFMRGANMTKASETDLSELYYELGETHAQAGDAKEAILFFRLSLGPSGRFRDAEARIFSFRQSLSGK